MPKGGAELPGVVDIVPGARTVLIKLAGPRYQSPTRQRLGRQRPDRHPGDHRPPGGHADVVIDVVYDGGVQKLAFSDGDYTQAAVATTTAVPTGLTSITIAEGEVYVIDSEVFRALYLFLPPELPFSASLR